MPPTYRNWVAATTMLGAAFRFRSLFANHFHADEALFASWARQIAVWRDPLLVTQPVDKPPLLFYLQAFFYPFFGPVEWAARLPDFIASLLIIPLLAVLAWRFYNDGPTAVLVALLMALSPLAIQFSATAFTDPLLAFWLILALAAAVRPSGRQGGRVYPVLGGVAFGLAAATKYQAWLFLPLIVGFALLAGWSRHDWLRALGGVAVVGAAVGLWLLARADSPSLWALQVANAGGLRPSWSWELAPRLVAWVELWRLSLGWPLIMLTLVGFVVLVVQRVLEQRPVGRITAADKLLAVFLVIYVAANWLFAVPIWDRYLLPVLPLALLLVARTVVGAARYLTTMRPNSAAVLTTTGLVAIGMIVLLSLPASAARLGRYPLGGRPSADDGAWLVGQHLQDEPYGTVLYDHWYSWQWRYHLFDSGVYVSWFPHADALIGDLAVFGADGATRYVVLPDGPAADPVRRALAEGGYELVAETMDEPAGSKLNMALFRIARSTP